MEVLPVSSPFRPALLVDHSPHSRQSDACKPSPSPRHIPHLLPPAFKPYVAWTEPPPHLAHLPISPVLTTSSHTTLLPVPAAVLPPVAGFLLLRPVVSAHVTSSEGHMLMAESKVASCPGSSLSPEKVYFLHHIHHKPALVQCKVQGQEVSTCIPNT